MSYSKLLKDPRWQKKRIKILERDNFTCTLCGDKETELHVQHNSYQGNPWDIKNIELKTLCKHCHLVVHKYKSRDIKVHKYYYDDCNIWSISVFNEKRLDCFLYEENNPHGLQEAGIFSIDCFNELNNFINNG